MEHGIGNLADLGNDSRAILVLKLNILHEIQISRQGPVDFSTSLLVSTSYSVRSYGVLSCLQNHSQSLSCNLVY